MTIRCIAFDLDDTLWACQPVIKRAEKKHYNWLEEYYPELTKKYSFDALMQSRNAFMANNPELVYDLTQLRKYWLHGFARELNYDDEMVESAFHTFWLARNEVTFYDGVLDVLNDLSKDFSLGIISNGNADINHIGVGHLFDFSVSAREAGVAKPHPTIFQLALQKAGIKEDEAVYVGDDPIRDIQGANQAGWHSIWYNPESLQWQGEGTPSQVITNFNMLEEKIKLL